MIRAVIFDLDDTLYLESDFVTSGCRAVADYTSKMYGVDAGEVFCAMMKAFVEHGRTRIMPIVIERFLKGSVPLHELVKVYRQHIPTISLLPGYREMLAGLARQLRLGIITDGLPSVQSSKIHALDLEPIMDKIIYTWDYGSEREKPNPFSFLMMLDYFKIQPEEALFVGDNPEKDCIGARGVGMKSALVRPGIPHSNGLGNLAVSETDIILDGLHCLPEILRHL